MSFFIPMTEFELPQTKVEAGEPNCRACGLYKNCGSPKIGAYGNRHASIMVVFGQPSAADDVSGQLLSGAAGREISRVMREAGLDPESDSVAIAAVSCHSKENPTKDQIQACRPMLVRRIEKVKPKVIILVGRIAVSALIGHLWKDEISFLDPWVGWAIPDRTWNCWICPIWSSAPEENPHDRREPQRVLQARYIRDAVSLLDSERPWPEGPPNFEPLVERIYDPKAMASAVKDFTAEGLPTAFDLETTTLKPEGPHSKIVCVSYSTGQAGRTVCGPMTGPVIDAHRAFLESDVPKIASNLMFEHDWGLSKFRISTQNWVWDTMQVAHIQHVVKNVSSIKFQAFVHLGQPDYDSHIAPYLESEGGGYAPNRIHEINPADLYLYCGMDSLLEIEVARKQAAMANAGEELVAWTLQAP